MAIKVNGTTVIDNSRNIGNVNTVEATSFIGNGSGLTGLPSGTVISATEPSASAGAFWFDTSSGFLNFRNESSWVPVVFAGNGSAYSGAALYYPASEGSTLEATFQVPSTVLQISVVAIGYGSYGGDYNSNGNGGGALAYKNNIPVYAGQAFTVSINQTRSRFTNNTTVDLIANAGTRSGTEATFSGADGGGNGGRGGIRTYVNAPYFAGAGSGGAGGYTGSGGHGADTPSLAQSNGAAGSGGGGGGGGNVWDSGYYSGYAGGSAGGGTSPFGLGSSGAGGLGDSNGSSLSNSQAGYHGSIDVDIGVDLPYAFGAGGLNGYGGSDFRAGGAIRGCIRIVWGIGDVCAFPSTNVGYRDGTGYSVQEARITV